VCRKKEKEREREKKRIKSEKIQREKGKKNRVKDIKR
jgi:hypothetical protein